MASSPLSLYTAASSCMPANRFGSSTKVGRCKTSSSSPGPSFVPQQPPTNSGSNSNCPSVIASPLEIDRGIVPVLPNDGSIAPYFIF